MGDPSTHARLSPSDAKRWTTCTAAIGFCEANKHRLAPDSSLDAINGEIQHDWNEKYLKGECALEDIPSDRQPFAVLWKGYCESLQVGNGERFIEARVPLWYSPDENGRLDFAWVSEQVIHIVDYKNGAGILVPPDYNKQLAIYAHSLVVRLSDDMLWGFSPDTVVSLHIVQPRHREAAKKGDNGICVWSTTVAELADFCADIERAAGVVRLGEALEFAPDADVCRWCRAKAFCTARLSSLNALPERSNPLEVFENLDVVDPGVLSDEQLVSIYRQYDQIKRIIDDVKTYMTNRALDGHILPGTKLVMGREGNREFVSDEKAAEMLRNQRIPVDLYTERRILGPAKVEKIPQIAEKLKEGGARFAKVWDALITRSPAKRVLALESDKRTAVSAQDALPAEFLNLDVEDE